MYNDQIFSGARKHGDLPLQVIISKIEFLILIFLSVTNVKI